MLDEAKKAGAYDPKMYAIDTNLEADLHSRAAHYYYDGKSQEGNNDLSMLENGDISPTGAANPHNRQPSFLTKDFNISRHERQKSAMGLESDPSMITVSDPDGMHGNLFGGGAELIHGKAKSNQLTSMTLKPGIIGQQDAQNRRKIKSVLPSEYSSNTSAASSTPLEENNVLGNRRNRNDKRNSAYEAIQARLKEQVAAKRSLTNKDEDSGDPFTKTTKASTETTT